MPSGTLGGGVVSFFVSSAALVVLMGFASVAEAPGFDALGSVLEAAAGGCCFGGAMVEAGLLVGAAVLESAASDAVVDCFGGIVF